MIRLFDNESDKELGSITDAQLEILMEELADESVDEYTYNLNPGVIGYLEGNGTDPDLIRVLRQALGSRSTMELRYDPD